MPKERISGGCGPGRWVSRPPHRECPWSTVEIPPALAQQIRDRVRALLSEPAVVAAETPNPGDVAASVSAN